VPGNVGIENTSSNALKLVEFFNKDIIVSKGAEKPLIKECEHAHNIHGESGMDGYDFKSPKRSIYEKNSVEAMREIIQESDKKLH
jgi:non-specific riboncleoside hydrolase